MLGTASCSATLEKAQKKIQDEFFADVNSLRDYWQRGADTLSV